MFGVLGMPESPENDGAFAGAFAFYVSAVRILIFHHTLIQWTYHTRASMLSSSYQVENPLL